MWNGAPGSSIASAASSAAANGSTSVNAPSLVACMCAKSSTGRTQSTLRRDREHVLERAEVAHAAHHLDAERHRAVLRLEPLAQLAELLDDGGERLLARRGRAGSRGGRRPARRRQRCAMPAEWSSIPSAMLNFLSRSAWPMKPASGACTESAMSGSRASSPSRSAHVVVHPEAALEVDLAGGVAALDEERDGRLRALPAKERAPGRAAG